MRTPVALHTRTAPLENGGRGLVNIELYAMWAHSRSIVTCVKGELSPWEKQVLIPPLRDFCHKGRITVTVDMLSRTTLAQRTDTQGSALAQTLRLYSRYQQVVTGPSLEVTTMSHVPLLPALHTHASNPRRLGGELPAPLHHEGAQPPT